MLDKVKVYGFICLFLYLMGFGELKAYGSLLEVASLSLKKSARFSPARVLIPTRFFSSGTQDDWNTGYVPATKQVLPSSSAQVIHNEEPIWHFDPVRSLPFYYITQEPVAAQKAKFRGPIKQDGDMVVYAAPDQKKSLELPYNKIIRTPDVTSNDMVIYHSQEKSKEDLAEVVTYNIRATYSCTYGNQFTTKNESIISPIDGRVIVRERSDVYPWSIHGFLEIIYGSKVYVGTGIMVNPFHVLTAGHCLFSQKEGVPDRLHFFPGRQGNFIPWKLAYKSIVIHPLYHASEDTDSDLGMVILGDDKIGLKTGWARLKSFDDDRLLHGLNAQITGYPADKFIGGNPYMYTMSGPIKVAHKSRLYYGIDTFCGQSGSGVCVTDTLGGDIIDCFGIHTTGSREEGNGSTRINEDKLNTIKKWIKYSRQTLESSVNTLIN